MNATSHRVPPPNTSVVSILVSNDFLPQLVGRTIHCAHFRIELREDGFYDMTVCADKADNVLNDVEEQFS